MAIQRAQAQSIFIVDDRDFFSEFIASSAVKLGSYDEKKLLN